MTDWLPSNPCMQSGRLAYTIGNTFRTMWAAGQAEEFADSPHQLHELESSGKC